MKASGRNSRIQRHTKSAPNSRATKRVARYREAIHGHIEKHWGDATTVFQDIIASEYIHVDIHVVAATKSRPYHTLITSGMSDRPMTVPKGAEELRLAELVMSLPASWPLGRKGWDHERHWWPFHWLKQ